MKLPTLLLISLKKDETSLNNFLGMPHTSLSLMHLKKDEHFTLFTLTTYSKIIIAYLTKFVNTLILNIFIYKVHKENYRREARHLPLYRFLFTRNQKGSFCMPFSDTFDCIIVSIEHFYKGFFPFPAVFGIPFSKSKFLKPCLC